MNARYRRVPTRFAPEKCIEIYVKGPAASSQKVGPLELLKTQLLEERLQRTGTVSLSGQLLRAANEAAALVSGTEYPLLLFPALFEERADAALSKAGTQEICAGAIDLVPAVS